MDIITQNEADNYLIDQLKNEAPASGTPASIITDVSKRIASYIGRDDFGEQITRTEYHNGNSRFLFVKVWPIVSIAGIWDDTEHEFDNSSLIDAGSYWISQNGSLENNDGIIFSHNGRFTDGYQNIKITYTGGYATSTDIPSRIKQACKMQVAYEVRINTNSGFGSMPKTVNGAEVDPARGLGLLSQVQVILNDYVRKIPFA
jgi:hypothetical protein